MGHWFQMRCLKRKENPKQDQLHNNKKTDGATSISGIKDKLYKQVNMVAAVSSLDLHVLMFLACLMSSMYLCYQTS
jgi:hypothetical protein